MGELGPGGVVVGLGVLGGTLGVEVGTKEIAIYSESEYSIICTCFGPLCDKSPTIGRKLAELGSRPKGCQNDENHWPEASDAIFVHFKEQYYFTVLLMLIAWRKLACGSIKSSTPTE